MDRRRVALCMLAWPLAARRRARWSGFSARSRATLRFFGLRVYDDARSGAPRLSAEGWAQQPLRSRSATTAASPGEEIAKRSLVEMRRQGPSAMPMPPAGWPRCKPPSRRERGRSHHRPARAGAGARFFVNGRLQREVREPGFATRFFGIWLSPQTSEPGLREQLLR